MARIVSPNARPTIDHSATYGMAYATAPRKMRRSPIGSATDEAGEGGDEDRVGHRGGEGVPAVRPTLDPCHRMCHQTARSHLLEPLLDPCAVAREPVVPASVDPATAADDEEDDDDRREDVDEGRPEGGREHCDRQPDEDAVEERHGRHDRASDAGTRGACATVRRGRCGHPHTVGSCVKDWIARFGELLLTPAPNERSAPAPSKALSGTRTLDPLLTMEVLYH